MALTVLLAAQGWQNRAFDVGLFARHR